MGVSQAFFAVSGVISLAIALMFFIGRGQRRPVRLRLRGSGAHDSNVRNLTICFLHNGHDFDAYEVLGLPAGSSAKDAEEAYRKQVQGASDAVKEMLDCAFEAIKRGG